jgi:hypothetical protein
MGCGASKDVKYDYKNKTHTIKKKDAIVLNRWGQGAVARFRVLKMKREFMQKITRK